jgi:hypothetical protein
MSTVGAESKLGKNLSGPQYVLYCTDLILSQANAQDANSDPLTHGVFRSQEINAEKKTGFNYYFDAPPLPNQGYI